MIRRWVCAIAVLFCAAGAAAQEFEIFDPNDFIDPRERGAVFDSTGFDLLAPGRTFSIARFYGGYVSDYQWRDTPTRAGVGFAHLTLNRYSGTHQYTFKFTGYDPAGGAQLPTYRATAQISRYFAIPDAGYAGAKESVTAAGRILVTASIADNPLRNETGEPARRFDHEFGVEFDSYVRLKNGGAATGSLSWSRFTQSNGSYGDRLLYLYRGPEIPMPLDHVRLSADVGAGGVHTDRWHWGATRLVGILSVDLPDIAKGHHLGAMNVAFAPTYIPGSTPRRLYREVTLYFDTTLGARIGRAPRPRE